MKAASLALLIFRTIVFVPNPAFAQDERILTCITDLQGELVLMFQHDREKAPAELGDRSQHDGSVDMLWSFVSMIAQAPLLKPLRPLG